MISAQAKALAEKTADAYSADRYRSWAACAALLLRRGFSEREAEAILRSKWTRWAGDMSGARYGAVPAKALARFLDDSKQGCTTADVAQLVLETFDE